MQHERIIQQQCLSKGFMFRVQAWLITNTQRFMHVWVSVRKIVTRSSIFKQIFSFSRNAYLANVLDAISSYYKFKISKARQCLPVQTLAYANKENKHRASFFFFLILHWYTFVALKYAFKSLCLNVNKMLLQQLCIKWQLVIAIEELASQTFKVDVMSFAILEVHSSNRNNQFQCPRGVLNLYWL